MYSSTPYKSRNNLIEREKNRAVMSEGGKGDRDTTLGGAMPACTPRGPSPDFRHLQMSESWVRSIREESDIARDQGSVV